MGLSFNAAIDGGTISFEDGLKAAEEYAPARKVRVELNFSTVEGGQEDAADLVASIGDLAKAEVHRLLTGTAPVLALVGGTDTAAPAATRTRRTKAQIAEDNAAAAAKAADPASVEDPTAVVDPAAVTDDPSAVVDPADVTNEPDPAGLDFEDEFTVQPPEEDEAEAITDADLNSAVQKKNAELSDPPRIRELIGSYNPDPKSVFQLRQIPADKRREFLDKLGALKKAA